MTVRELVEKLEYMNPDAEVVTGPDHEYCKLMLITSVQTQAQFEDGPYGYYNQQYAKDSGLTGPYVVLD